MCYRLKNGFQCFGAYSDAAFHHLLSQIAGFFREPYPNETMQ